MTSTAVGLSALRRTTAGVRSGARAVVGSSLGIGAVIWGVLALVLLYLLLTHASLPADLIRWGAGSLDWLARPVPIPF